MKHRSEDFTATRGACAGSTILRVLRFGVVGTLGTAVYYLVLWGLVELLHVAVLPASSSAFVLVCIENYVLHYVWTFASTRSHAAAFPRFSFMTLVGFFINWAIMFVGVSKLGFNYLVVQAAAIAAVIVWNYSLSTYWIFRDSHLQGSTASGSMGQ